MFLLLYVCLHSSWLGSADPAFFVLIHELQADSSQQEAHLMFTPTLLVLQTHTHTQKPTMHECKADLTQTFKKDFSSLSGRMFFSLIIKCTFKIHQ